MRRIGARVTLILLNLGVGWVFALPGFHRQEVPVLLTRNDHSVSSMVGDSLELLYSTDEYISRVKLSRQSDKIAIVQSDPDPQHAYELVVLDSAGTLRLKYSERSILKVDWCCRNGVLAVSFGTRGADGFDYEGIGLLDTETGEIKNLDIGSTFDMAWSSSHGLLFAKVWTQSGLEVVAYNPESAQVTPTSHLGVYFSPDGEYYLDRSVVTPRLFRTSDDEELTKDILSLTGFERPRIAEWHSGSEHALVIRQLPTPQRITDPPAPRGGRPALPTVEAHEDRYVIVDVEARDRISEFSGSVRALDQLASPNAISVTGSDGIPRAIFAEP